MKHDILYRPVYSLLKVELDAGESISAESGAMVTMTPNIEIQTSAKGGLLSSLKRSVLGGESFFQNTFTSRNGKGAITFAPSYMGDVEYIPLSGEWLVQGGSYLCSTPGLTIDTKFQGMRGLVSGESLFFLKISGQGDLFISSFGAIHPVELQAGEEIKVDTGNLVAFQQGITYSVERVGGIKSTMLSGEGLVLRLQGPGKLFIQTRSPGAFAGWLYPLLPKPQGHQ
jgi:uncharacterized protein (TIGR00266 family)